MVVAIYPIKNKTMKINLTNKEYVTLLEVLHMADWVLHAHYAPPSPNRSTIEQKTLALAKEFWVRASS